jgi:S1-C subfamily serine protease
MSNEFDERLAAIRARAKQWAQSGDADQIIAASERLASVQEGRVRLNDLDDDELDQLVRIFGTTTIADAVGDLDVEHEDTDDVVPEVPLAPVAAVVPTSPVETGARPAVVTEFRSRKQEPLRRASMTRGVLPAWLAAAAAVVLVAGVAYYLAVSRGSQPTPLPGGGTVTGPAPGTGIPSPTPAPTPASDVPAQAGLSLRWSPPQVPPDDFSRGVAPVLLEQVLPNFDSVPPGGATLGGGGANPVRDMQLATVIVKTRDGWGSGAVISADGWVLTNYHVVESMAQAAATSGGNATLTVVLPAVIENRIKPGAEVEARLFRADPVVDLALLKITRPPADLRSFTLAAGFNDGDECIAIGSQSNGPAWWVRRGIVSQQFDFPTDLSQYVATPSRQPSLTRARMSVIVSDTRISPGDSGGPLLNDRGELIGLTFATPQNVSAGSVGWHVALQHLQKFTANMPAAPEAVPFDAWTAGLGEGVPLNGRDLDGDADGRADAVEFVYGQRGGTPQETTAAARTIFVDFQQRAPRSEQLRDRIPFGLWGIETLGRFRFDLFVTTRDDHVVVVGYTNERGIVDDIRIGSEQENNATTVWQRSAAGAWRASHPTAMPLVDAARVGAPGMARLVALLRGQAGGATPGAGAGSGRSQPPRGRGPNKQ